MIKIYSIKEIVEASNNILNRTKIDSKSSFNKKNKKIFFKKEKPLILSEEVLVNKKIHVPITQDLVKKNKNKKIISKNNQNTLIDQLYLKFNKKIKKNTLKLIFELQKEVSDLNQNNDFINKINSNNDYKIYDYTKYADSEIFLEGTGSFVLDRTNRIAYCSISERSSKELFLKFCKDFNYNPVSFKAYHTYKNQRKLIFYQIKIVRKLIF